MACRIAWRTRLSLRYWLWLVVASCLDLLLEVGVETRHDIELAGLRRVQRGLVVGDVVEDDLLDLGLGAPVLLVALERDRVALLPALQDEGPGPVGRRLVVDGVALLEDRARSAGQVPQQLRVRLAERDGDLLSVGRDRRDARQRGGVRPRGVRLVLLQRPHHVLRGERLAVVERHALAQRERVGETVIRHGEVTRQRRYDLLLRRAGDEALIDVVHEDLVEGRPGRLPDVEVAGLQDEPDGDGGARVGLAGTGRSRVPASRARGEGQSGSGHERGRGECGAAEHEDPFAGSGGVVSGRSGRVVPGCYRCEGVLDGGHGRVDARSELA